MLHSTSLGYHPSTEIGSAYAVTKNITQVIHLGNPYKDLIALINESNHCASLVSTNTRVCIEVHRTFCRLVNDQLSWYVSIVLYPEGPREDIEPSPGGYKESGMMMVTVSNIGDNIVKG